MWAPLGPEPVERFAASYRAHPAGLAHRLVVLLNGFGPDEERRLRTCDALDRHPSTRPSGRRNSTLDLPAYAHAARVLDAAHLCFVNSHAEGARRRLAGSRSNGALAEPGVGVAGATGSYESPALDQPAAATQVAAVPEPAHPDERLHRRARPVRDLRWPDVRTKAQAWELESGTRGMTAQVRAPRPAGPWSSTATAAVHEPDRRGRPARRPALGDQAKLLIADNRTRDWAGRRRGHAGEALAAGLGGRPCDGRGEVRTVRPPHPTSVAV